MKVWEYKRESHGYHPYQADEYLNKMGRQGWELVSVVGEGFYREYYWKRKVHEDDWNTDNW